MEILKNLKIENNRINQYIIDFNLDNKLSIEEIENLDFFYIEEIKKILPKIEVVKPNGEIVILNEIKITDKDCYKYEYDNYINYVIYLDIEIVVPEDVKIAIKNKYSDLNLVVGDKEVCFYNGDDKYNFEYCEFDAGYMVEYYNEKKAIILEINNLLNFTHNTKLRDVFDVDKVTTFSDIKGYKKFYSKNFIDVDITSKNNNDICYDLELRFLNNYTVKTSGKIKYLEFFRDEINKLLKRNLSKLLSVEDVFTSNKYVEFKELNNKLYFYFDSSVEKALEHKVIENINIHDIELSIIKDTIIENLEKKQNKKNNILLNLKTIADNINNLNLEDLENLDNAISYCLKYKVKHDKV